MMGYCDVKIATKQLICSVSANSDTIAGRVAPEMGGAERRQVSKVARSCGLSGGYLGHRLIANSFRHCGVWFHSLLDPTW